MRWVGDAQEGTREAGTKSGAVQGTGLQATQGRGALEMQKCGSGPEPRVPFTEEDTGPAPTPRKRQRQDRGLWLLTLLALLGGKLL